MAHRARSSSITYKWTYDVFLSFYGDDTRLGFISHLYQSLHQRGIHVFIDYEIRNGEKITPALFTAIEQSRIAIIVFSENYANSTFCLRELKKILKCFKEKNRLIYPVFYHVDPSELRHPRGSYAKALARLEKRFKDNKRKVEKWRQALSQAAELKGCHLKHKIANEQDFITGITNEVAAKINQQHLDITDYQVGLVSRAKEVISCLNLHSTEETKMIGIWGAGGIGKSIIARAVYNSIADNFEALCFLSDVRKKSEESNGLSHLQEKLLDRLVMAKDLNIGDYHEGIPIIKRRVSQKKILLILDDVDKIDQLKALAGSCDWFGCGSRIIITTRNKQLLAMHDVKSICDVKELDDEDSLKLLSWHAFKEENVDSNYRKVCSRAIKYSCGFPLALEVIGSSLRGKEVSHWSSALDQLKNSPYKSILGTLKLSYDTLEEDEKRIFLDSACFFNGEKLALVVHVLQCVHGIQQPEYPIGVLVDNSLIKVGQNLVTMHDLIEDVGKEIVRQESPNKPGEQSRLWFYQDILHVLEQDTGTDKIEAIVLDLPESLEVQWSGEEFKKMKCLKMLVIRKASFSKCPKYLPNSLRFLEWKGYPFKFLPSFCPIELVYLDLSFSYCELLQPFDGKFRNLSSMNLRNCEFLQQIPDLSGASNLRKLWLDGCTNLIGIHESVGCLNKLIELSAMRCKNLKILPSCLKLPSLKHLNLFGCSSLQKFPEVLVMMEEMQTLDLDKTAITELPSSICNLKGLEILNMEECPNLEQLPASIFILPKLWKLTANSCQGLSHFKMCEGGDEASSLDCSAVPLKMERLCLPNCNLSDNSLAFCLSHLTNMIHLDLSFSSFTVLPECITEYHNLKFLLLDNCTQLQHIGGMPPNLEQFSAICCISLTKPSKSEVLKQAFSFQLGKRNFIFPEKELPEGLHYYSRGSFVSFWIRNVFPTGFLWIFVKGDQDCVYDCEFSVHINEHTKLDISSLPLLLLSTIKTNHIYICDLQSIIHDTELPLGDEWNQVKVFLLSETQEIYFGVHVYNRESNIENIQFVDPGRCIIDHNLLQKIQEQQNLEELKGDMKVDSNLTKFAESMHNREREIMYNLQPSWDLKKLKVEGYRGTIFPTWLGSRSYHSLMMLRLTNCNNCRRIPTLGQLPAMRSLTIERLQSVEAIGSEFFEGHDCASLVPFPSLETLHVGNMVSWEEWHSIDVEAFPKLYNLRIHDCPKLIGNLPRQLPSLEFLEIERCPLLASCIPKCPKIHQLHIIESQNVVLQEQKLAHSLHRLAISDVRMLENLSEKLHIQDLIVRNCSDAVSLQVIHMPPSVKETCITDCENVKFVLVSKAPLLHLRRISISRCNFLISLFDDMERLLPNLKELSIKGCPEMEPFALGLLPSSLKRLEIRYCYKLLSCHTEWHHLPTISKLRISTLSQTLQCKGLQHLTSLQELEILDSPNLKKIEEGMMPPSLQRLRIRDCRLLEDEEIWPKISHVRYINLDGRDLRDDASTNDMHEDSDSMKSTEYEETRIMHDFESYRDLEILDDGGYSGITVPIWSGGRSYDHLIELRLTDCKNCWRIPAIGHLPALRSLRIERLQSVVTVGSEFFKADDCASLVPFPSLETLHFEDMISWQVWHSVDIQAFPKLRILRLVDCSKLIGNLPHQFLSLERLGIKGCPLLASSIPKYPKIHQLRIIQSDNVVLQEQELPPSLRHLEISGTRMLESLSAKSHIENLVVRDCSYAVPPPVIQLPSLLKELHIEDCENHKFVLDSKAPLLHLQKISIYRCKSLTSLCDDMGRLLPNLKKLSIERCPQMESFAPGCLPSSLEQLEIRDCRNLLFPYQKEWYHLPSITTLRISTTNETLHCEGLQHLTSLQELEIWDSPHLDKIEGMLPPLQRLRIRHCMHLEERFRNKDERIWPKISHVPRIILNDADLRLSLVNLIFEDRYMNSATIRETRIMHDFESYRDLEILDDGGYSGITVPIWPGSRSYDHLIELRLTDCKNCWRIPAIGHLPALRSLRIRRLQSVVTVGSEFFKADDCASLIPFPSLETLHFEDMISWQVWHSDDIQAFPKLRILRLVDCSKLIGNLPHQLLSLERLGIKGCPLLASSIPKYPKIHQLRIIQSDNVVLQEQELPPSLRHLEISGTRMLEFLSAKSHIENLVVRDCSYAVPPPVIHLPSLLKELRIEDCENHKFVLDSKAPLHLQKVSIYRCKSLTFLCDDMGRLLQNLKEPSIERCAQMKSFEPACLPCSLEQLEIGDCDELLFLLQWHHLPSITTLRISTRIMILPSKVLQHLTSLKELEIRDSPNLRIIVGMLPPLQRLRIRHCMHLEERCRNKDERIWPKISHVPRIILNDADLRDLFAHHSREVQDTNDATIQVQSPPPSRSRAMIKFFNGCSKINSAFFRLVIFLSFFFFLYNFFISYF